MKKKNSKLTADNLKFLSEPVEGENAENEEDTIRIEETGKKWLKANLKIDADKLFSNGKLRKSDVLLVKQQSDGKDNLSISEVISRTSSNLLYESASQNGFRFDLKNKKISFELLAIIFFSFFFYTEPTLSLIKWR